MVRTFEISVWSCTLWYTFHPKVPLRPGILPFCGNGNGARSIEVRPSFLSASFFMQSSSGDGADSLWSLGSDRRKELTLKRTEISSSRMRTWELWRQLNISIARHVNICLLPDILEENPHCFASKVHMFFLRAIDSEKLTIIIKATRICKPNYWYCATTLSISKKQNSIVRRILITSSSIAVPCGASTCDRQEKSRTLSWLQTHVWRRASALFILFSRIAVPACYMKKVLSASRVDLATGYAEWEHMASWRSYARVKTGRTKSTKQSDG